MTVQETVQFAGQFFAAIWGFMKGVEVPFMSGVSVAGQHFRLYRLVSRSVPAHHSYPHLQILERWCAMLLGSLYYAISWLPYGARAVITLASSVVVVFIVVKIIIVIKNLIANWL